MTTPLGPRAAYELWADTYAAAAHNPLMRAEAAVVERLLMLSGAKRALDVGTGSGRYLPILSATGAAVVGVDLSMAMLRSGARTPGWQSPHAPRPSCLCADACRLPFRRASFDLVNASLMVGDVADLRGWSREMSRVLATGGHLVYSDFHPTWSENGWQRTFRSADGRLRAVSYQPHTIDDHLTALDGAGFHVQAIREPRLKVGRRERPVLAVFHAIKEAGVGR
jgi:malonyl-CoA O-methyltransferase